MLNQMLVERPRLAGQLRSQESPRLSGGINSGVWVHRVPRAAVTLAAIRVPHEPVNMRCPLLTRRDAILAKLSNS